MLFYFILFVFSERNKLIVEGLQEIKLTQGQQIQEILALLSSIVDRGMHQGGDDISGMP